MKKYFFNTDRRFKIVDEPNVKLKENQIRIKMKNCGICGSDIHYYLFGENGGRKIIEPLMLGHEFVGEIIELGSKSKIGISWKSVVNIYGRLKSLQIEDFEPIFSKNRTLINVQYGEVLDEIKSSGFMYFFIIIEYFIL